MLALLRRRGIGPFLEDRFFAGCGSRKCIAWLCRFRSGGRGYELAAALRIRLLDQLLGSQLTTASIVVGLLSLAVLVDGAFALTQQIENLAKIIVAPALGPLFTRFGNILQSFTE